ncbi:MAG: glucosaminidase domain-containing protein [Bacteroidales bacterium]|nr:glucosaminidase domain-containing protein [Bacteroidales bacterium]
MKNLRSIFISLTLIFAYSVSAQMSSNEYIELYKELAIKEMKRTGIPASITLAQALLESGNGNSDLAKTANNHFGIKCHSSWTGKKVYKDDDAKNECFRKYPTVYESYIDHSDFIVKGQRYAFLFEYESTDYKKWAHGLKKAGYATSSTYATRLIEIIERYELFKYDSETNKPIPESDSKESKPKKHRMSKEDYAVQLGRTIETENGVMYIVTKTNDTYSKLTDEFQMLRFELYKYNDVTKASQLKAGERVYLQPKRNKADKTHTTHTVKMGETLYDISQMYAIKLKKLIKRNHLQENLELNEGQVLKLR